MKYKTLNEVKTIEILQCVNKAFSDYSYPINFSEVTLNKFIKASNINKSLSFCAYSDEIMVGFIFNSSSIYKDELVVFDAGTGVIPEFRGQGVFTSLYAYVERQLNRIGIKKYYLEVLQQNTRAKTLYNNNGFMVTREFSVLHLTTSSINYNNPIIQYKSLEKFDFSCVNNLTLIDPSYEHSYNVIIKNPELYRVAYLENDCKLTAFCVFSIDNGSLITLAYSNIFSLKEIIKTIASSYKSITAKNIDTSYSALINMMYSIGFTQITSQYEMVKSIS